MKINRRRFARYGFFFYLCTRFRKEGRTEKLVKPGKLKSVSGSSKKEKINFGESERSSTFAVPNKTGR